MKNLRNSFESETRQSTTGVHVKLLGSFDSTDKPTFSKLIQKVFCPEQRIFFDVRSLEVNGEMSRHAFKQCISDIPAQQVFFKGKQGFELGNQGNRILVIKDSPCKCDGACKSCACDMRVKNRNEKHTFHLQKHQSPEGAEQKTIHA